MRKIILLFSLAAVIFTLGCASAVSAQEKLTVTKAGTATYPPKPKKEPVEIFFTGKPQKPYDVIAEVSGSFTGEPKEVLEAKTRKAGGDAMIITDITFKIESSKSSLGVEQRSRPADIISPTYTPGYSYKVYTVKGQIIKYKQ
jgi:hypothetical protein